VLNIHGGELLIILLVALVFLGPQRLPEVARQVGQTVNTLRGLAKGFQAEIEAAARPDPLTGAAAESAGSSEPPALKEARHGPSKAVASASPGTDTTELADKARNVSHDDQVRPVDEGAPSELIDEEE